MEYKRHYVWSIPLRIFHWVFALSIVGLVVTGLYIHWPWTNTMLEGNDKFPMATMRNIHFQLGFVFLAMGILRSYLLVFGRKQERLNDFLPISLKNIKSIPLTARYYLYISDKYHETLGHNGIAGLAFCFIFVLSFFQTITGLYLLYPESALWKQIGLTLFCTPQYARLIHYFSLYMYLTFSVAHIYMVSWNEIRHPGGMISSISNGYKFFPKDKET